MPDHTDFRQHLEVETPEHVVLDYEIAGLGSRALAAILDTLILAGWAIALLFIVAMLSGLVFGAWSGALYGIVYFASIWGYFVFFEALRAGQTPGKRRLGIRVVRDTGHPVTFAAAAARNLLRVADFLPPPYLIGAILVALHPRGKRLGDLVAGTVVVRDRPAERPVGVPAPVTAEIEAAGVPELTDEEFRILGEFASRAPDLDPAVRGRLAARLAIRLESHAPPGSGDALSLLARLHHEETARRRGRFGGRAAAPEGGAPGRHSPVERLVARKGTRWDEFQQLAERATQHGLDSLAAEELPDFAARYREVAADLARARTYRAAPGVLARLERLVAAGHNSLYRDERRTFHRIWSFLTAECPAAIIEARAVVLLAFLTFALPAVAGFLLLRERPALAEEVLPQVMLERAEAGAIRQQAGQGYFEAGTEEQPLMASAIMTNNITVAFNCFAGGVFAGVGSLVLLAFNGLSIGATSAHFANVGLLGYLWTFIMGHGVLELFAIWVAGAAGLLLGLAVIAPGDLTRGDALVVRGRLAIRMIGAVIVLLVLAGLIEGFVSAGSGSLALRVGVSAGSLVFLVAHLANGADWRRRQSATQ